MTEINRLSRSVKLGVLTSALLSGFYLVTEKTSWLQKKTIICGGTVGQEFVKTADPVVDIEEKNGEINFCVREVLRPYSESMADVWAGVTIYPGEKNDQKLLYVESQYFVAKDFGEDKFSDEPGDWVSKNVRTYSRNGILVDKSDVDVSSAVDSFLDAQSGIKLWEVMQDEISQQYNTRQISWFRLISENATQITVFGLAAAIAWKSISRIKAVACETRDCASSLDDSPTKALSTNQLSVLLSSAGICEFNYYLHGYFIGMGYFPIHKLVAGRFV